LDLLKLHPASQVGLSPDRKVQIFGAFKDSLYDRQIGDGRRQNGYESRIPGPSKDLPTAALLTRLQVAPKHGVKICITDRADFYHQIGVSDERSQTNCVWPAFCLGDFEGTKAHAALLAKALKKPRKLDRAVFGDALNGVSQEDRCRYACVGAFGAILQGDQLGVEIGIDSHAGVLKSHGLLGSDENLVSSRLVRPSDVHQGLVIDDYFAIAQIPVGQLKTQGDASFRRSKAHEAFRRAKDAYASESLKGSDLKDIIEQTKATVIGAEIDSLVSAFCFRRCAMCLLSRVFRPNIQCFGL